MRKLALAFAWVILAIPCQARVIYVDANTPDNNDGSSWGKAYKYLQNALADANSSGDVNEIWVADGNYYPDANTDEPNGSGSREATFQLINGVAMYGGFAGGETSLDERDWQTNVTTLSGDINTPGDASDNSYHVVTGSGVDETAVLNGFTITGGNANGGSFPNNAGGGMYNDQGSPTVTNCTFSGNSAYGDTWYGGAGIYNNSYSSPTVTNCTFSGNTTEYCGGGVNNQSNSSPKLTNCTFTDNWAGRYGGGMYNRSNCSPTITNCKFSSNSTGGSSSEHAGGAMRNIFDSSPMLTNCTFSGNWAADFGGAMANAASQPNMTNCTFSGNTADANNGGGMFCSDSNATLTNCILWGNTAGTDGNEIALTTSSTIDVNYCDVEGGEAGIYKEDSNCTVIWGNDNIETDPLFADADLRLQYNSPCIDAGDNISVPNDIDDFDNDGNMIEPIPYDLDGRDRFTDGDCNDSYIVDMGACEFSYAYIGDFDADCAVDFVDYAILTDYWLMDELLVDIAPTPGGDGIIDWRDLDILCGNWLVGQ